MSREKIMRRAGTRAVRKRRGAPSEVCRAAESGLWPTCGKRDPRGLFASVRAILGCHRAVLCPIPSRLGPACPHMRVAEAPSPIGLRQVTLFSSDVFPGLVCCVDSGDSILWIDAVNN